MKKEVIAFKNPKSPISEIFRTLRTNIQFMNVNKKMKVLLVTSTFPGEGKSWITANLAVTFAQTGKKVVVIDSDMRKGRQYAIFGVLPKPGLSNFLSQVGINEDGNLSKDMSEYIQETGVENLYLMSAGTVPPNPSELLVSAPMIRLLDELKEVCDLIIIDGTPSELVADSVILSRIADSTLIITAHKMTKKDALERVIKNIKNVGGNIAGVVINKVPVSARRYGEKYYYYGSEDRNMREKDKKSNSAGKFTSKLVGSFKKSEDTEYNVNEEENNNNISTYNTNVQKDLNASEDFYYNSEKMQEETQLNETNNNSSEIENKKIEETNDILRQINDYLEKEKKKL